MSRSLRVTVMLFGLFVMCCWGSFVVQGLAQDELCQQESASLWVFKDLPSFIGEQRHLSDEELEEAITVTTSRVVDLVERVFTDRGIHITDEKDCRQALQGVEDPLVVDLIQDSYYLRGLERIRVRDDLKALLAQDHSPYVYDLIQRMLLKNELASLFEVFEAQLERRERIKRHASCFVPNFLPHIGGWVWPIGHGTWHVWQTLSFRRQRRFHEALDKVWSGHPVDGITVGQQLKKMRRGSLEVDRRALYRQIRTLDESFPMRGIRAPQVSGDSGATAAITFSKPVDTRVEAISAELRTRMNPRARELLAFLESGEIAASAVLRQQAATLVRATGALAVDDIPNQLEGLYHKRAESMIRSYEIQGAVRQINAHMPESVSPTTRERLLGQLKSDSRALHHLSLGRMSFARGMGNSAAVFGEIALALWGSSLILAEHEEWQQWRTARGLGADEFKAIQEAFDMHGNVSKGDLHKELWRLAGAIDAVKPIVEDRFNVKLPQVPELTSTAAYLAKVLAQ